MELAAKFVVFGVPTLIILTRHFREKSRDRKQDHPAMNE